MASMMLGLLPFSAPLGLAKGFGVAGKYGNDPAFRDAAELRVPVSPSDKSTIDFQIQPALTEPFGYFDHTTSPDVTGEK
jgi:hypothetical protein